MFFIKDLQSLIEEANCSLEDSVDASQEIFVVILHRKLNYGSVGISLAGGSDYENKEITVLIFNS